MKTLVQVVLASTLLFTACKKSETKPGESAAKPVAAKAAAIDYSKVQTMITAAKTGDDFMNILTECGSIAISAAADKGMDLTKDATHVKECKVAPAKARAALALAESTPDKMSPHCLAASMDIEELAADPAYKAELEPMVSKIKTACGM